MTTYFGSFNGTTSGSTPGVFAAANDPGGAAIDSTAIEARATGERHAITATGNSQVGRPIIYAINNATAGTAFAISGVSNYVNGYGIYGLSSSGYGVYGNSSGQAGVCGFSDGYHFGVLAKTTSSSASASALYAEAPEGGAALAGRFLGNITVAGSVSITGGVTASSSYTSGFKYFLIDHPLDPENKTLRHASVESSERKNLYDGVGIADDNGELVVRMPNYLEALNEDFRYQLTALGTPAPRLHVKEELIMGRFVIGGAAPGQRVCWMLSGNRKDALAAANPLAVEEDKAPDARGRYLHPEAYGLPPEKRIAFVERVPHTPPPDVSVKAATSP